MSRPRRVIRISRPLELLVAALVAAVAAPGIGAVFYSGHVIWPLMITSYSGASLAFLTALAWDRHSRLETEVRERDAEHRREEARLQEEQERRVIEAKRRLGALELELERLKVSIERTTREQKAYKHFFPDLPTGSWLAASGPLAVIMSDYELMADLSTFYGHVDELRWRLRFKAEATTDEAVVSPMIDALAGQMSEAVDVLLKKVAEEIRDPQVEHVAGAPEVERPSSEAVIRKRQFTGAIRVQSPEELARAMGDKPASPASDA